MSLLRGPTGPPSTGSRIVEVHDGSSQFAGDAGSSGACWAAVGAAAGSGHTREATVFAAAGERRGKRAGRANANRDSADIRCSGVIDDVVTRVAGIGASGKPDTDKAPRVTGN